MSAIEWAQGRLLACFLDRSYTDPRLTAAGFVTFSDDPTDGAEAAHQDQTCF